MRKTFSSYSIIIGTVFLAGCNAKGGIPYKTLAVTPPANQSHYSAFENTSRSPLNDAFIKLPSRYGNAIAVTRNDYQNGVKQKITYFGAGNVPGENHIDARMVGEGKIFDLDRKLSLHSKEGWAIERAFQKKFPGKPFNLQGAGATNRYGSYGFAFANLGSGVGCILGWQTLLPTDTHLKSTNLFDKWDRKKRQTDSASLSYRIRYCGQGFKPNDGRRLMEDLEIVTGPDGLHKLRRTDWYSASGRVPSGVLVDPSSGYAVPTSHYGGGLAAPIAPNYNATNYGAPPAAVLQAEAVPTPEPLFDVNAPRIAEPVIKPKPKKVVRKKKIAKAKPRKPKPADYALVPLPE